MVSAGAPDNVLSAPATCDTITSALDSCNDFCMALGVCCRPYSVVCWWDVPYRIRLIMQVTVPSILPNAQNYHTVSIHANPRRSCLLRAAVPAPAPPPPRSPAPELVVKVNLTLAVALQVATNAVLNELKVCACWLPRRVTSRDRSSHYVP